MIWWSGSNSQISERGKIANCSFSLETKASSSIPKRSSRDYLAQKDPIHLLFSFSNSRVNSLFCFWLLKNKRSVTNECQGDSNWPNENRKGRRALIFRFSLNGDEDLIFDRNQFNRHGRRRFRRVVEILLILEFHATGRNQFVSAVIGQTDLVQSGNQIHRVRETVLFQLIDFLDEKDEEREWTYCIDALDRPVWLCSTFEDECEVWIRSDRIEWFCSHWKGRLPVETLSNSIYRSVSIWSTSLDHRKTRCQGWFAAVGLPEYFPGRRLSCSKWTSFALLGLVINSSLFTRPDREVNSKLGKSFWQSSREAFHRVRRRRETDQCNEWPRWVSLSVERSWFDRSENLERRPRRSLRVLNEHLNEHPHRTVQARMKWVKIDRRESERDDERRTEKT